MLQADLEILPVLEGHLNAPLPGGARAMVRVVNVVAAIPQAPAAEALARISLNEELDESVRRAAQQALAKRSARQEPPRQNQTGGPDGDPLVLAGIRATRQSRR
jgi:hypothetical protein